MRTLIITKSNKTRKQKLCIGVCFLNGEIELGLTPNHHSRTAWLFHEMYSVLSNSKDAEILKHQSSQFAIGCARYSLIGVIKRMN